MAKIRVLIADDHAIVRTGVRGMLNAEDDLEVVGEAEDAALAIAETERLRPDVVVLDLSMPGGGTAIIAQISKGESPARVVVLTMYDDPSYLREAVANGADGFVSKSAAGSDLIAAIRSVHAGRSYFSALLGAGTRLPRGPTAVEGNRPPVSELSPREQAVLQLVAEGHTNKEVATSLQISVKTVETYRARLAQKAGLKSRAQLVRYALDLGLIGPKH